MPFVAALFFVTAGFASYLNTPEKLFGINTGQDGNHFLPGLVPGCRLWSGASRGELARGWISTAAVCAWAWWFATQFYAGWTEFAFLYGSSWIAFNFFLVTVTYLQHHEHDTKIYDDSTWKYTTAAFETIDRKFGWPIDMLTHHISDGHMVHHLWFSKIPHYHLRKA